jgi:alginate O-acetyltransferase complex protein AlgI
MLFISYAFLFVFLPLVLFTFYGLRYAGRLRQSVILLTLASVAFYAYWKPADTFILLGTIVFNYFGAGFISTYRDPWRKVLLAVCVAANLSLLIYFKYFDFLATNIGALVGIHVAARHIVMPIGISFFTFTQIAYLVDCYKSRSYERAFGNYTLFVTIFPHLIAGPIIHHAQMRPQFGRLRTESVSTDMIMMGVVIFIIGMAKKVLLADNLVSGADAVFNAADHGLQLGAASAWIGTIAYTLQIYFDFSGYSDMAIGLGLMFGLRLPINFDSPYKSKSIIEFWRRWHITLSAWLRDYLYIPLGGNRTGEFGRLRNVFVTFLLGGMWHGAGWTFIIWGALHGTYVVANHIVRGLRPQSDPAADAGVMGVAKQLLTLLFVMVAWVFFRAKSVSGAWMVLKGMIHPAQHTQGVEWGGAMLLFWMALAGAIALFAPSTQQLTHYTAKLTEPLVMGGQSLLTSLRSSRIQLGAMTGTAILCGVLFAAALACIWRPVIFIYFNF